MEALWPGRAPASADSALSALLSGMRRALGEGVVAGRGQLHLSLPDDAWVDVEVADEAIHRAESAVARSDWTRVWGPSLAALVISRREFLPEADAPWADAWRRRLGEIHVSALECYCACALGIGGSELPAGERAARELVGVAPLSRAGAPVADADAVGPGQSCRGSARLRRGPLPAAGRAGSDTGSRAEGLSDAAPARRCAPRRGPGSRARRGLAEASRGRPAQPRETPRRFEGRCASLAASGGSTPGDAPPQVVADPLSPRSPSAAPIGAQPPSHRASSRPRADRRRDSGPLSRGAPEGVRSRGWRVSSIGSGTGSRAARGSRWSRGSSSRVGLVAIVGRVGALTTNDLTLPGTDSQRATDLLADQVPAAAERQEPDRLPRRRGHAGRRRAQDGHRQRGEGPREAARRRERAEPLQPAGRRADLEGQGDRVHPGPARHQLGRPDDGRGRSVPGRGRACGEGHGDGGRGGRLDRVGALEAGDREQRARGDHRGDDHPDLRVRDDRRDGHAHHHGRRRAASWACWASA